MAINKPIDSMVNSYIPNTFRMPVKARVMAEYNSLSELRQLLADHHGEPILPVGEGSNLLFTHDYEGVVLISRMVRARALDEDKDSVLIEAEAGLKMDTLIEQLCDMGLWGMENLSHIPGTVGASAVQNVGAYGVEAKDVIVRVNTLSIADGTERVFTNEECQFGYRDSIFKNELHGRYIVTSVLFRLQKDGEPRLDYGNLRTAVHGVPTPSSIREAVIAIRRQKLPEVTELGSAGSFFKNPVISSEQFLALQMQFPDIPHYDALGGIKVPAAWLIEQCGWKGKSLGGARCYEKQPLVLVNAGNATPDDIVNLATAICRDVKTKFNITISPEVNYI